MQNDEIEVTERAIDTIALWREEDRFCGDDFPSDAFDIIISAARHRLATTPARGEVERLREALAVGERFLNSCFSAWSCGEPSHRVKTMLDNADAFRAALSRAPEPRAPSPE